MDALRISDTVRVPEAAFQVKAVRAGGPGGQNVNKVASKIEVRVIPTNEEIIIARNAWQKLSQTSA